ncbi:MAG: dTMP kinase [Patescibacteria group bacterium]
MKYHIEFDIDFKRNKDKGLLIAIEGIDGAGKTTQAELVAKELSKKHKVYETKNPTDGVIGKFVRQVLAGKVNIPPVSFQYLFSADRQVQQEDILNKLREGKIVVTDRYFWSAIVYGIVDRDELDFEKTGDLLLVSQGILSMYHRFIVPDLTIFLDIPLEVSMKRIETTDKKVEIYENLEKLKKIHKGYNWLINKFKKEFTIVDGTQSQEEVTKEIIKIFNNLNQKRNGNK